MDFRALEVFAAVIESMGFSRAAERLGVSQPTVSQHVRQLEEELDTALIIRSTREFSITDDGHRLYQAAVDLLDQRRQLIGSFFAEKAQTIRLGVSTIPAGYVLPELIATFRKERPDIRLRADEGNSAAVIDKVLRFAVDVGIVGMRVDHDACEFVPFYRDEIMLITPHTSHYRAMLRQRDAIAQAVREPIIVRESGSGSRKHMDIVLEELGVAEDDLDAVATINDVEVIKRLVAQGVGVSFVSGIAAKDAVARGEILAKPLPEHVDRYRYLYLVHHRRVAMPTYVAAFLELTRRCYSADG